MQIFLCNYVSSSRTAVLIRQYSIFGEVDGTCYDKGSIKNGK